MKPEKPAPGGADFSDKSNGSRHPEATAPDTSHQAGTESETLALKPDLDEIDELAADPIHDHRPRAAPKHKVNRVIGILDHLDRENTNRRFSV